jgi:hypothetical protein
MLMRAPFVFIVCLLTILPAIAAEPSVSIITDARPSAPVAHGLAKLVAALKSCGAESQQVNSIQSAHGKILVIAARSENPIAADLIKSNNLTVPEAKESLLIHHVDSNGRPMLLLTAPDERGLMYALLDVADRVRWAGNANQPFEQVRDSVESPAAPQRALSVYTVNRANWESRFYDDRYWQGYFDLLAQNRFNSFVLIFGYENGGFLAPPYPYFFDTEGFDAVRMIGITPQEQQKNLAALNRLIQLAHERGIDVTLGIWDHIYRGGVQANGTPGSENALKQPTPHLVWGVTAQNLTPYTKAALSRLLKLVPDVDAIQFRMHDESGLKNSEQVAFWHDVFGTLKQQSPKIRFDLRAKGLPDTVIDDAVNSGINFRITTKFWMEQMGLPFHPTHINPPNQFDRRHSYADLLRYPQRYRMHWRLWNGGTARVLLWADPDYARRFVDATHLYDGDGFEVNEPLCTKMQAQAHDAKPFELLNPQYRYYDYEFERYWHLFQVFGRLGYNPDAPAEIFDREFARRFGAEAGPHVEKALHRASQVLPRIVAACYPYSAFPMTRGWAEKQILGDLAKYASAETSDVAQFASFDEEAQVLLGQLETAKTHPTQTARWFQRTSDDVNREVEQVERQVGERRSKEFISTITDLKILSNLALFHARRIPAAVAWNLYKRTGNAQCLDEAIAGERSAQAAWQQLVAAAGDVYTDDLAMGNRKTDLCGHWKDQLPLLERSIATLQRERERSKPPADPSPAKRLAAALADTTPPPQVQHTPVHQAAARQPLTLTATIASPAGIKWARLRYRSVNQHLDYESLEMRPTSKPDEYGVTVPASELSPRYDFMYYIEALDAAGRGVIFPDLETQTPYVVVSLKRP